MFARGGLLPLIEVIDRNEAALPLEGLAEGGLALDPLSFGVDVSEADFDILGPKRYEPPAHYVEGALTGPGIVADHREEVGRGTFQLGAMLGVGRSGGIEKTSLISLTSEERRAERQRSSSFTRISILIIGGR